MRSELSIRRALRAIDRRLTEQLKDILNSAKGFGGPESYGFDELLSQRHVLRWALGMRHEPFHPVADWERFKV